MRWPFGPPHLTLKPSQKTEKQNKKETKKHQKKQKQNQHHPTTKKQSKQTEEKQYTQHQKEKQTQETQKHLNLPDPNKQEEAAPQSPKTLEKQANLTLLQLYQTKKHNDIKAWKKKQTKKTPFCHVQKQPAILHQFLFLFTYSVCIATAVLLWKHYKIVFSEKHSFSKTQLVKPTFSPISENTFFSKKGVILVLGNFRWNHYFYSVSCFALLWAKKNFAKTDSVHENARFSPFPTQIVSRKFWKNQLFDFHILDDHLKKTLFL